MLQEDSEQHLRFLAARKSLPDLCRSACAYLYESCQLVFILYMIVAGTDRLREGKMYYSQAPMLFLTCIITGRTTFSCLLWRSRHFSTSSWTTFARVMLRFIHCTSTCDYSSQRPRYMLFLVFVSLPISRCFGFILISRWYIFLSCLHDSRCFVWGNQYSERWNLSAT